MAGVAARKSDLYKKNVTLIRRNHKSESVFQSCSGSRQWWVFYKINKWASSEAEIC